jgi:hypothetical protein
LRERTIASVTIPPHYKRFQAKLGAGRGRPANRFYYPVSLRLLPKSGIVARLDAPIGFAFEIDHQQRRILKFL